MTLNERLKEAREMAGYASARSASEALSIPPSTYASHENGSRGVKIEEAMVYARRFRVDPVWLVFGKGDLSTVQPVKVDQAEAAPAGKALVPVFDVAVSAGPGALAESEEYAAYSLAFPPDYLSQLTRAKPENLSIISVKGESMIPTLHDDDIVMLDRSKTSLDYDGLFVLRFGETLHVKRVTRSPLPDHIKIISDNTRFYPPEDWPKSEVTVIGKVIWKGGKV